MTQSASLVWDLVESVLQSHTHTFLLDSIFTYESHPINLIPNLTHPNESMYMFNHYYTNYNLKKFIHVSLLPQQAQL